MRAMRVSFLATALSALAACPAASPAVAAKLPGSSPAQTAECEDAAAGVAMPPPRALRVGPFRMLGRKDLSAHWNPATRRFTSKVPVVILGSAPVTVTVPGRLAGRLVLACAGRRATFFPGGWLFTRREPLSLSIQPVGWVVPRLLKLGVLPPY